MNFNNICYVDSLMYNHHMEHYICTGGCAGVSDLPGVCHDPACPKVGQPLDACDCDTPKEHHRHRTINTQAISTDTTHE